MISRRAFGFGLTGFAPAMLPAAGSPADAATFEGGDVDISPDDVSWFRQSRSIWIDCESGAPALIPGGMTIDSYGREFDTAGSEVVARAEKTLCAFFLNAAFRDGLYRFGSPLDGRRDFTVTEDHIKLLQHTNWRTSAIDCKRPYGDYTNYAIDMARALGLEVTRNAKGYAEVAPEVNAHMDRLHREMRYVLQAYVEHAELAPGRWFIPYDGWDYPVLPRCAPVPPARIVAYKAAMAAIAVSGMSPVYQVVPRMRANGILFETGPD